MAVAVAAHCPVGFSRVRGLNNRLASEQLWDGRSFCAIDSLQEKPDEGKGRDARGPSVQCPAKVCVIHSSLLDVVQPSSTHMYFG